MKKINRFYIIFALTFVLMCSSFSLNIHYVPWAWMGISVAYLFACMWLMDEEHPERLRESERNFLKNAGWKNY